MDRKQILDSLKAEMIETLQKVLRFETVTTDALPGMPFGKNNADCLAYVLKKGEEMGFKSYNCDNYAGHLGFCRLTTKTRRCSAFWDISDVVPVTEGWDCPSLRRRNHRRQNLRQRHHGRQGSHDCLSLRRKKRSK